MPTRLGNFTSVTTNGTAQTRTANQQNEITSISGQSAPTYDANGNLTADGTGNTYVYDAWNQLVAVKNNGTTVASFSYDGLGRRITQTEGGTTTDLYYSAADQVLEEDVGGVTQARNVWSILYVNALVLRDQSSQHNGVLDQRLYVQQDANWNVTALVSTSGSVLERYDYSPYGSVTVLSSSWVVQNSTAYYVPDGFQGMPYDWIVSMNEAQERVYDPALGRWLQTDPIGLNAGNDDYEMEGNGPTDTLDPSGLVKLFGQQWVAPWNPNASWNLLGGIKQYGRAAGVAIAGTASGAASGAATGAATGAGVGAIAGAVGGAGVGAGPGALAGAGTGATAGAIGGGISGLIGSMVADDAADAAKSGLVEGAIAGPLSGGPAALIKVRKLTKAARAAQCATETAIVTSPIHGLTRAKYDLVVEVLNGRKPYSALKELTKEELDKAIKFYRGAGKEVLPGGTQNVLTNQDRIRRALQADFQRARAYFLEHGGQAPGTFNEYVIRNYPERFIKNELPQVYEYMRAHPNLPRFGK